MDGNPAAVVTGGSSGIGRRIATALAAAGMDVVNADLRREPRRGRLYDTDLTRPTDDLIREEYGVGAAYVEADLSKGTDAAALVEATVERFGRLDVLVNNAGVIAGGDSQGTDRATFERVLAVNLVGAFLTAKHAVPHLAGSDRGRIVNVASVNALFGGSGPAYAASKAGLLNLTRDLACEVAPSGTTVNAVLPGYVKTAMQDESDERTRQREADRTPLPRLGEPEDVASAVRFLASEDAEWITGASLVVDGGYTAGLP